ncbi:carbohydrate kinase family protein [Microbacterium lacusdiani]|jgi:fructokinase
MSGAERIVVVGEALVDVVHRADGAVHEAPGGSAANTALTLGRLGRAPLLVTRLGDDDRGGVLRRWLGESGADVAAADAPRTASATARLDATGSATYAFDIAWDLGPDLPRLRALVERSAGLVHVGSIGALLAPGGDQVREIVRGARAGATVTYDPNIRPSLVDDPDGVRARVTELVGLADVVKASDEDLQWLHPGRDVVDIAREWASLGPAFVVVTLGADGAVAVTRRGDVVRVPAVATAVVDTVGAGDTFMGVLIDGVAERGGLAGALRAPDGGLDTRALEALLRRCATAAAVTVSRPGADPPRRDELDALLP